MNRTWTSLLTVTATASLAVSSSGFLARRRRYTPSMGSTLCSALERRFADARVLDSASGTTVEHEIEGATYRAELAMAPVATITVALPPTDGFELRLRWNDRWANSSAPRAASFDDSFLIETNDLALATLWLDHGSRSGLLMSRYVSAQNPARDTALLLRDASWTFEVVDDEVRAHRSDAEPREDRMADILVAALILAAQPRRWADAFADLGHELGCDPAQRIEFGGLPVLRVRRGHVDVLVHVVRRLGREDPGRLRTLIRAHRHGSGGETLSLVSDSLPRSAWPAAMGSSTSTLSIDSRAAELLDLARPSATTVRAHDVEISFDGLLSDRDRLGAAIELAARWATATYEGGPYR